MSSALSRSAIIRAAKTFVADPSNDGRVVSQFFRSLGTPLALEADRLFLAGQHQELLDLDINPASYEAGQGDLFHLDYLAISFLSKSRSLKTGYDKKKRGVTKFLEFEDRCRITNRRFISDRELENSDYALWLFTMRRKIDLILGDFDTEEFFDLSAWGPGVTTLLKGEDTSATRKFQSEIGITRDAYSLLGSSIRVAYPGWFREEHFGDSSMSIQEGNTITSVPKNSKIDRIIAVEPGINLYFQKGVGGMIKRRLRRRGVDLTDQSKNQRLALEGSLTGALATVDFSSASDSISKELVRHLLPLRWYTVMNSLRSKVGLSEGTTFTWEKFSSMGNGFTFELESLIFYAAALTTCELLQIDAENVSVYGDDVIIPAVAFHGYRKFCEFLGFSVNAEKSFFTGFFRESCGAHYFRGLDVKPLYHKESLTDAFSIFKLANSIRRLSHRRNFNYGCDVRFLGTWRRILQGLPVALRGLKIPEGYGDGGILSNFDESCPPTFGNGFEGFRVLTLSQRGVRKHQDCNGLLQERLTQVSGSISSEPVIPVPRSRKRLDYGLQSLVREMQELSSLGYGNDTSLRGRVTIGVAPILVPQWYDLGGWS